METKQVDITIPSHVKHMRIKHLPFLVKIGELGKKEYTIREMREMNAAFLGVPFDQFPNYYPTDDIKLFHTICKAVNTLEAVKGRKLPDVIKYDGNKYELVKDFTKLPTSWFIDIDIAFETYGEALEGNPSILPALCYIEKGMSYGERDKHNNIINSLMDRAKIFEEHMPLNLFLDLQDFFLSRWQEFRTSSIQDRKRKLNQKSRKPKDTNGRKR